MEAFTQLMIFYIDLIGMCLLESHATRLGMKGFFRRFLIGFAFVPIATTVVRAATVYTITLNPNGGTANPDYLATICRARNASTGVNLGLARPNNDGTCPTSDSAYSTATFSLTSSPVNEFPQKYANHIDATDGYETFLGYKNFRDSAYFINSDGVLNVSSYKNGIVTLPAWWQGVENMSPFTVNYYNNYGDNETVATQSCTFGDTNNATICNVLNPVFETPGSGLTSSQVQLTPPAGKYFDGWFCRSPSLSTCRANRYLPANYASLSTPIAPYGTSPISDLLNVSLTQYRTDLRDSNGNVVTNMSYAYTGTNIVNLYAGWAPYSLTLKCSASSTSPFVKNPGPDNAPYTYPRVQSTYLDASGIQHDIVYGSAIPLDKNFGGTSDAPLCKSVYYEYDIANGNDQWCSEYLDTAAGIGIGGVTYGPTYLDSPSISGKPNMVYLTNGDSTVTFYGSCTYTSLNYSCGQFNGVDVSHWAYAPNNRYQINSNGEAKFVSRQRSIYQRGWPMPAYPYKTENGEYVDCGTFSLNLQANGTAAIGCEDAGDGITQNCPNIVVGTATDAGHGCCHKPQFAEFKGYRVTRGNNTILNNGELVQPGQYGAANCNVSFDENTNPNTWQPGCDLWPWKTELTLTAVWEHTPIQITFNHNGADNAANLINSVYMKYGEGFYQFNTSSGYSGIMTDLAVMPTKTDYVFGGYQYCDANDVCTMVVNSNGEFISGANNLKFTDVDVTATAVWNPETVVCAAGTYLNATTQLCETCVAGNYCPGGTYEYSQNIDLGIYVCGNDSWSDDGAAQCTACLTANGYHNSGQDAASHAHEFSCMTTCSPGQCISVARSACANVGTSGWSAGGVVAQGNILTCHSCTGQTFTSGSAHGAHEAADCGRLLHMGQYQVFLRANQVTNPSLQAKIYDEIDHTEHIYYGNLYPVTEGRTGHMHTMYMGNEYIICDQTGEVCTGVPQEGDPLEQNNF